MHPIIVYVKTDSKNRITAVNSSVFLHDATGWIEIDHGYGDRYHHAQGNYFNPPLHNERGFFRYKLIDGVVLERAPEELEADHVNMEQAETVESLLLETAADHEYRICLIELGIDESEVI